MSKSDLFIRDVQATVGAAEDGDPGPETWRKWTAYKASHPETVLPGLSGPTWKWADAFLNWVQPLPKHEGASPICSSGFVDDKGVGPNQARYKSRVKRYGADYPKLGHLGGDYLYRWDHRGPPPPTLFERHFYCPPVPVYAMGPGVVEYGKWKHNRFMVKIVHGELPGFGFCVTWSVHHAELLVKAGDTVEAGQQIAVAGDTGARGAPHVHQEIWRWQAGEKATRRGAPIDPELVIPHLRVLEP